MSNQVQNSKTKILIFSLAYFPHIGGAEIAIREITDRLSDFEFEMVTWNFGNEEIRNQKLSSRGGLASGEEIRDANTERIGNVNVYRVDCAKIFFPFFAYLKARKLHRLNNYQIAWGMMANLAGLGALFFKLRNKSVKYLLTLQTGNDDKKVWKKTWWWRPLYKMIYRKADYIQAISNYLAERGKRMGAKCPIEVVPNGVDLDKFEIRNPKFETNSKLEIKNLKPENKMVVTASRLVEKNGVEDLIQAVQLIVTSCQLSVMLLIAGAGKLENKLKDLVKELKLEDRVIFLGQVNHKELAELYQRADVFVRPSLSEGLGIAFLEAMSAGVPVIATSVGGIPDFLIDGVTGWFCEVKNPKSIAEKINYVLDERNKDEVKRVVEKARKMVEEKYNWDKIALRMGEIFRELL